MEIFEICAVDPGLLTQERDRMLALVRVPGAAFAEIRTALDGTPPMA